MVPHYRSEYLRRPTIEDVQKLLEENAKRGFSEMLRSVDCMHWPQKNCPVSWARTFKGHVRKPTIILEAIASYNLWFWNAFFGSPSSCNDLNVLQRSTIFDVVLNGIAPPVNFILRSGEYMHSYDMGYYVGNGIYPRLATIVKAYDARNVDTPKKLNFNIQQQAKRNDVEHVFGVLKAKWAIVACPMKQLNLREIDTIMRTCIILHNMVVEENRRDPTWK